MLGDYFVVTCVLPIRLKCETLCRTPGGQAKLSADVKSFLAETETLAKERRQIQKNSLWDEKMKATQTQSAFGVQCL